MRDRLFITISDSREARQYSVNPVMGKLLVFMLSGHTLLFVIGVAALGALVWEIDALRFARDLVVKEYRIATDEKARLEYKARDELKVIEEAIRKKREELGIITEVGKPAPDKGSAQEEHGKARVSRAGMSFSSSFGHFIPVGVPMPQTPMASGFGMRSHPVTGKMQPHNGVDYNVPENTPVYATGDGMVETAQDSRDGYGLMVSLRHPYNFQSWYAHLSQAKVAPGQIVRKGDLLGSSGNSGLSTGPHLHYEVHYDGRPLDPALFVQSGNEPSRLFQRTRSVPWASLVAYHRP